MIWTCPQCNEVNDTAKQAGQQVACVKCNKAFAYEGEPTKVRSDLEAARVPIEKATGIGIGCVGATLGLIVGITGGLIYHGNHEPARSFHGGGLEALIIFPRAFIGGLIGIVVGLLLSQVIQNFRQK